MSTNTVAAAPLKNERKTIRTVWLRVKEENSVLPSSRKIQILALQFAVCNTCCETQLIQYTYVYIYMAKCCQRSKHKMRCIMCILDCKNKIFREAYDVKREWYQEMDDRKERAESKTEEWERKGEKNTHTEHQRQEQQWWRWRRQRWRWHCKKNAKK